MEKRIKKSTVGPIMILLVLLGTQSFAQESVPAQVPLPEALNMVKKMHPQAVAAHLQMEYRKALLSSANMMPKTTAEMEGGQSEGRFFDLRLSAIQTFQPMGLVKRQEELYNAQFQISVLQNALLQKDIDKLVRQLYNQYAAGTARLGLLQRIDSQLNKSIEISKLRVNAGETDKLETVNLQLLSYEWMQAGMATLSHQQILRKRLGILLQKEAEVEPLAYYGNEIPAPILMDTGFLQQHPSILLRKQDEKAAALSTQVEKALYNPEWFAGLTSKSITGWQSSKDNSTETFYDIGNRFYSGTVGIHFQLFNKGGKARVAAAGINEQYTGALKETEVHQLKLAYNQTLIEWQGLYAQLKYIENTIMPGMQSVSETSLRRFQTGSISYIEWSFTMRQVLQAELNYIDLRRQLEEKIIDLQYFNNN
jgi:outer membrane protein TolC